MLFNLFGKKDNEADDHVFIDRAYVSTAAKMKACAELANKEPNHVFICWFADTAKQFKDFFRQQGLDENLVTETHYLHASKLVNKIPVFTEHYPLHNKELDLIKNWEANKIVVYSALDEALFRHFGSDKLIPLIKMLGMKEDEAIEHPMVTKSIIKGQEKIAEQVTLEQSASSLEEWMRKNIH
jgi:flavodoxin